MEVTNKQSKETQILQQRRGVLNPIQFSSGGSNMLGGGAGGGGGGDSTLERVSSPSRKGLEEEEEVPSGLDLRLRWRWTW